MKLKIGLIFSQRFSKHIDYGLLVMRIGLGIMFLYHGAPKIFGGPELWAKIGGAAGNFGLAFAPTFWGFMAALAEFGGGLCLVLGLFIKPAMILLVINLIVASSSHFAKGQGPSGASHAIEDGVVFLSLIFIGPGKYSLDNYILSKKKKTLAN
jgi:putative oxidoreductase